MRAISERVLATVVAAAVGACWHEARAQEQRYQLEANECAFVAGAECRELLVAISADSTCILVNGVPVACRRSYVGQPVVRTESDDGADYSKVPFVLRMVQGGMTATDAVALCRRKEAELGRIMSDGVASAKLGGAAEASWGANVQTWTSAPENQGIVRCVNKEYGGYSYALWSDPLGGMALYSTSLVMDEPPPPEPTVESVSAHIVGFFQSGTGDQLMVLGEGGGGSYISGRQAVAEAREQIDTARSLGAYVSGPFSERQLKLFGLFGHGAK